MKNKQYTHPFHLSLAPPTSTSHQVHPHSSQICHTSFPSPLVIPLTFASKISDIFNTSHLAPITTFPTSTHHSFHLSLSPPSLDPPTPHLLTIPTHYTSHLSHTHTHTLFQSFSSSPAKIDVTIINPHHSHRKGKVCLHMCSVSTHLAS